MGLFLNALMSACTASSPALNQQEACQKATEAGYIQTGIQQPLDGFEKSQTLLLDAKAEEWLGKDGITIAGSTYFIAKTVQSKSLSVGLPSLGLADSIKTDIGPDKALLKFEWKF